MVTKWEKNEHGNWKGFILFTDEDNETTSVEPQSYYDYFWSFFY